MSHEILGQKHEQEQSHQQARQHTHSETSLYPMVDWFVKNQKNLLIAALVIAIGIGFSIWRMSQASAKAAYDIVYANKLANELAKSSPSFDTVDNGMMVTSSEEAVRELKAIDDQYPALQHRYDGLIAEELILEDKKSQIDPYATRSIENLKEAGLTQFAAFSTITRLTALGQYEKALEEATLLKANLETVAPDAIEMQIQKHEFALHAFTLLEIATLQEKLGKTDDMNNTLNSLRTLLGLTQNATLSPKHEEAAATVRSLLQEPQGSLLDSFKHNN
jgi:hypothetical protein